MLLFFLFIIFWSVTSPIMFIAQMFASLSMTHMGLVLVDYNVRIIRRFMLIIMVLETLLKWKYYEHDVHHIVTCMTANSWGHGTALLMHLAANNVHERDIHIVEPLMMSSLLVCCHLMTLSGSMYL
jgi:hypothetical protein